MHKYNLRQSVGRKKEEAEVLGAAVQWMYIIIRRSVFVCPHVSLQSLFFFSWFNFIKSSLQFPIFAIFFRNIAVSSMVPYIYLISFVTFPSNYTSTRHSHQNGCFSIRGIITELIWMKYDNVYDQVALCVDDYTVISGW